MTTGWTFRDDATTDTVASMIGYDVEATDGSIGTVTEESTAVDSSFIVVDTGFWILDKKRLIPASAITAIDHERSKVHVAMTKHDIKEAPDYVPESKIDDSDDYRAAHDIYYRPWFGI